MNQDRASDSVAATATNIIVLLQNPALPGAFSSPVSYVGGPQPAWVAVADLNGDGKPDRAVANLGSPTELHTASLSVLLQDPAMSGGFLPATDYQTDVGSVLVAVADLNGDGKADIAVANSGGLSGQCPPTCNLSGSVSVLLQDPAVPGHFAAAANYTSADQVLSVGSPTSTATTSLIWSSQMEAAS